MRHLRLIPLALAALACNLLTGSVTPESETPTATTAATAETVASPTETSADTLDTPEAATPTQAMDAEEAILILEPGPGSRVVSPLHVAGISNPAQHQQLLIELVGEGGAIVARANAQIDADIGMRGPFEVDVPFSVTSELHVMLQVSIISARDGRPEHLSGVGLTLAPSGAADIRPRLGSRLEQILILQPEPHTEVSGGVAHVIGFGLASFEQTLLIQVQDGNGQVVGQQPVIVTALDIGMPGAFAADVPYTVSTDGPGRIVVLDASASGAGFVHISSVEVTLQP